MSMGDVYNHTTLPERRQPAGAVPRVAAAAATEGPLRPLPRAQVDITGGLR